MSVERTLNDIGDQLGGRTITREERDRIVETGEPMRRLEWLFDLMVQHPLARTVFQLSEDEDLSGFGVDLQWMTPRDTIEEAIDYYPGIAAYPLGYVPVGSCLTGSGDPYFINTVAGLDPPLVRIHHDCLGENDQMREGVIDIVRSSLSEFLLRSKISTDPWPELGK